MKFFASVNLVTQAMEPCVPWEYKFTREIPAQIRKQKQDRQEWYVNADTQHQFYTAVEPLAPNRRPGTDNPPRAIHAIVADFDTGATDQRIDEAVAEMKHKPAFSERSLGGNFRLIWGLPFPLMVSDDRFCKFVLAESVDWLTMGLLPELDLNATTTFSRMFCNGGVWRELGPVLPDEATQAFFVRCGQKYSSFPVTSEDNIPLDAIERALKEKFPSFNWPSSFEEKSQGPTFWLADSASPMSAIVKPGGIFTFSMHADKPFYSWSDLLGKEFTSKFQEQAIGSATRDVYWDGKKFFKMKDGRYTSAEKPETELYMRGVCKISNVGKKGCLSPLEEAILHVQQFQAVVCAGSFVMQRPGMFYDKNAGGVKKLNTYPGKPFEPAAGEQKWGPHGNLPMFSAWMDALFVPRYQLQHWLAWASYLYTCAFTWTPKPGTNIFMLGGTGIGKTLLSRNVVGPLVGGYMDASDFLVDGAAFNEHLYNVVLWVLDDDRANSSATSQNKMRAAFKKIAANQQHAVHTKFEKSAMVDWNGRIICTTNLDYTSTRIVGTLDDSSLEKTSIFRCSGDFKSGEFKFKFPSREETAGMIMLELPYIARYLLDFKPTIDIATDQRYGWAAFQEHDILDKIRQTNPGAVLKEMIIDTLGHFFTDKNNAGKEYWEGSVTNLVRFLLTDPQNEQVLRLMRVEQVQRHLENIQASKEIECTVEKGAHNTRIWRFYNPKRDHNNTQTTPA